MTRFRTPPAAFAPILVFLLALIAHASAQSYRIGVVVSETGAYPERGRLERAAIESFRYELQTGTPVFASTVEIVVRDDGGNPIRAERLARELIEGGVHLLVCCSSDAASRRVTPLVAEHGVLTLSPTTVGPQSGTIWHYALAPTEETLLRAVVRHAFASGKMGLGLMTLDNGFGAAAREVLDREMGVAGMELLGYAAYGAGQRPLTPEALWVATREPGAVVVWGLRDDSLAALSALRNRGYLGPVYLRPAALDPASVRSGAAALDGVFLPLAPLALHDTLPSEHESASAVAALARLLAGRYGPDYLGAESATMFDALALALRAVEQATQYGVPPEALDSFRQALRDAAVGLPEYAGAGGSYDLDELRSDALTPAGLVVAEAGTKGLRTARTP